MRFATFFLLAVVLWVIGCSSARAQLVNLSGLTAGDRSQLRFTTYSDTDAPYFPVDTRRLALLIGNSAYDKAPIDTANPGLLPLRALNGCRDAIAIANRLASIGWQKSELVVLCDQTRERIDLALRRFLDAVPYREEDYKLMVVYLAGHGVNVDERNYFFGVNATPDYAKMASIQAKNALEGKRRVLFDLDAIDVLGSFTSRIDRPYFPILVVVDTCRNNPIVRLTDAALQEELSKHAGPDYLAMIKRMAAYQSRPTTGVPRGMAFAFATTVNSTVLDDGGNGMSRLADALDKEIVAQQPIDWILQEVDKKLLLENDVNPDPLWIQTLSVDGRLWIDKVHGSWCIYGCGRPGPSPDSASTAPASSFDKLQVTLRDNVAFWRSTLAQSEATPQTPVMPKVTPAPELVFRSTSAITSGLRPLNMDIFWCSGGSNESARYLAARAFGQKVRSIIENGDAAQFDSGRFETVRLRSISEQTNARPGYQRNGTAIYVDSGDAVEKQAAELLAGVSEVKLGVLRVNRSSPGYISAFFCEGAFSKPVAPLFYVQIPSSDALTDASNVISFLDFQEPDIDVQRRAEIRSDGPRESQVRYARADQKPLADRIALRLQGFTGVPVKSAPLCEEGKSCQWAGTSSIEYWMGQDDAASVNTLPSYKEAQIAQ